MSNSCSPLVLRFSPVLLMGIRAQCVVTSLSSPARMAPQMKPRSKRVAINDDSDLSKPRPSDK